MKMFLFILGLALGIGGTIGYQNYFCDTKVEVTADSTKIDSTKIAHEISPVMQPNSVDTAKKDTLKK